MKKILLSIACKIIPFFFSYYKFYVSNILKMSYFKYVWCRLFLTKPYWPIEKSCIVAGVDKIYVGKNSRVGSQGCYIQGVGGIYIGNYVRVTTNVGIMSRNHDLYNHLEGHTKPVIIRDYCWLGMGSKVMAGVELGPRTIVAANAVVTKSFPEGNCVLAGVPAKKIKELEPEKVVHYKFKYEMYGFLTEKKFQKYKKKHLKDCPFLDANGEVCI